jgi:hypothetical protein
VFLINILYNFQCMLHVPPISFSLILPVCSEECKFEAAHYVIWSSCHFIPLVSQYSPQHPVLIHPQSLCVRDQVAWPYKTAGRITFFFCILMFWFLGTRWEDVRSWNEELLLGTVICVLLQYKFSSTLNIAVSNFASNRARCCSYDISVEGSTLCEAPLSHLPMLLLWLAYLPNCL